MNQLASLPSAWVPMAARLGGLNLARQPGLSHPLCRSLPPVSFRPITALSHPHHGQFGGRVECSQHPETAEESVADVQICPLFRAATMVQGPSDAVIYASLPDQVGLSLSCAIKSSQANCVGQIDENNTLTITTSFQEPVKSYLVQGGGSPPAPTPAPSGSGSNSSTGKDSGSSVVNAAVCVGLLVGGAVAGMVILFLV